MEVTAPLSLLPGQYPTDVALRTVSEALAKAASQLLEIEPGELMAEYRPSLTPEGQQGLKAEIFLSPKHGRLVRRVAFYTSIR